MRTTLDLVLTLLLGVIGGSGLMAGTVLWGFGRDRKLMRRGQWLFFLGLAVLVGVAMSGFGGHPRFTLSLGPVQQVIIVLVGVLVTIGLVSASLLWMLGSSEARQAHGRRIALPCWTVELLWVLIVLAWFT